jgi:hypothetical protein
MSRWGRPRSRDLRRRSGWLIALGVLALPGWPRAAAAQIAFEERSAFAGLTFQGPSYGASWGDVNGDGLPDVWISNHQFPSSLFVNLGGGRFRRANDLVVPNPARDKHGAAWADFDGDGDQDLIQVVGGANPNLFYVNEGGVLIDRAAEYRLDLPGTRSRSAAWVDLDRDGRLDLVLLNDLGTGLVPGSAVAMNRGGSFELANPAAGFAGTAANYALISDFDSDHVPDLVIEHLISPRALYRIRFPLDDLSADVAYAPQNGSGTDSLFADFDNDGVSELFLTRAIAGSGAELVSPQELWVAMTMSGGERGISFEATGRVTFSIHQIFSSSTSVIRIGAAGISPSSATFVLDPRDAAVEGMPSYVPGEDLGVFIGYDPAARRWELRFSSRVAQELRATMRSEGPIVAFETIQFPASPTPPWPTLYRFADGTFVESRVAAGLHFGLPCHSVVAGDFDNDMDLDLYLACTGPVRNRPNALLENTGAGRFRVVASAGGAEGTSEGRADSVTTADYDGDGFLDLLVTNGLGGTPFNSGPTQLFRNRGNGNHWLAVDVRGPPGRRASAHGTRVIVETGGVRQVREFDGGYHRVSQNHARLHFGLGPHPTVDRLEAVFPDGKRVVHRNLAADRLLVVAPDRGCGLGAELVLLGLLARPRRRPRG